MCHHCSVIVAETMACLGGLLLRDCQAFLGCHTPAAVTVVTVVITVVVTVIVTVVATVVVVAVVTVVVTVVTAVTTAVVATVVVTVVTATWLDGDTSRVLRGTCLRDCTKRW